MLAPGCIVNRKELDILKAPFSVCGHIFFSWVKNGNHNSCFLEGVYQSGWTAKVKASWQTAWLHSSVWLYKSMLKMSSRFWYFCTMHCHRHTVLSVHSFVSVSCFLFLSLTTVEVTESYRVVTLNLFKVFLAVCPVWKTGSLIVFDKRSWWLNVSFKKKLFSMLNVSN